MQWFWEGQTESAGRAVGGMKLDKLDRKKYFVAQALNDLLAERTIEQISVVDLCEEAGISRSTFYTYFDDIYSVGEWLWDQEFRSIFEGLGRDYGYRECFRRLYSRLRELGMKVGYVRPMRPPSGDGTYACSNTLSVMVDSAQHALGRSLTPAERLRMEYSTCAEEAMTLKWFKDGMALSPETMSGISAAAAPEFLKKALGE